MSLRGPTVSRSDVTSPTSRSIRQISPASSPAGAVSRSSPCRSSVSVRSRLPLRVGVRDFYTAPMGPRNPLQQTNLSSCRDRRVTHRTRSFIHGLGTVLHSFAHVLWRNYPSHPSHPSPSARGLALDRSGRSGWPDAGRPAGSRPQNRRHWSGRTLTPLRCRESRQPRRGAGPGRHPTPQQSRCEGRRCTRPAPDPSDG